MGNQNSTAAQMAAVTRFGDAEITLDGKGMNAVLAAFLDESYTLQNQDNLQRDVIIFYGDALEVWSQGSGDRRRRNYFENGFVCASCYAKASNLGAVVGIGTTNGTVFLFSSDLETVRRSFILPGASRPREPIESMRDGDEDAAGSLQFELGSPNVPPLSEAKTDYDDPNNQGNSDATNFVDIFTVTFVSIPRENVMLVGDNRGRLHVYSLSLGERLCCCSAADEIKALVQSDNDNCIFNMNVVDGVFIPCVNTEHQKSQQPHELLAFATSDGFVTMYPYIEELEMKKLSMQPQHKKVEESGHSSVLSIQTQKFLICLACVTIGGLRYLLTIHSRCMTGWLIDIDSRSSQIVDFEEEIVNRNMTAYPTTAASYCDVRKLLFTGDTKGTVYVREVCSSEDGNELRMRLLQKASARDDKFSVTSLNYDPLVNILLIGDSSGVVRSIENVYKGDLTLDTTAKGGTRVDGNVCRNSNASGNDVLPTNGINSDCNIENEGSSISESPQIDVSITEDAMNEAFDSSCQNNQSQRGASIGSDDNSGSVQSNTSPTAVEVKNQDVLDEFEDGDEVIRL